MTAYFPILDYYVFLLCDFALSSHRYYRHESMVKYSLMTLMCTCEKAQALLNVPYIGKFSC